LAPCAEGHILFCVAGELETELADERLFRLTPGMTDETDLMKLIISIALALALFAAGGVYAAGWALSRPVPVQVGPAPEGLVDAESVAFSSQSGSVIRGWFSRAPAARASVLLLPGVRANRLSMVRRATFCGDRVMRRCSSISKRRVRASETPSRSGGGSVSMYSRRFNF
jgi:hypothetical protein